VRVVLTVIVTVGIVAWTEGTPIGIKRRRVGIDANTLLRTVFGTKFSNH
jgi:hypothetical protein